MSERIKNDSRCSVTKHQGNLLANLTKESLRKVRVLLVNKPSVNKPINDTDLVALKRRLENPDQLVLPGDGKYPIFDRSDIVVNNGEYLEERREMILSDNPAKDGKYKSNHVTSQKEGTERRIKYTKEEGKEVCRLEEGRKEPFSVRKRTRSSSSPRRSRDREQESNYKRRRYNEERYKRSPTRSPARNYKSSCDDKQCSCNKRRDRSSQFKENREWVKTDTQRSRRSTSRENTTRSRRDYIRERSRRSPYNKKTSHSSQNRRITSSTKHVESRSQRKRSLSPPEKINSNYNHEERLHKSSFNYTNQYGMPIYNFKYHGVQGLWIPAPHFTPRNIIPPVPMLGIPPYFIPRPPMLVSHPTCQFRPHFLPRGHRLPMPNKTRPTTKTSHISTTKPKNFIEEPSSTSSDKE